MIISAERCRYAGLSFMSRSLSSLFWLAFGAFAIGTEGFYNRRIVAFHGSRSNVSLSVTGQLITAFSFAYAIGAPVMAVLTATLERRRLLAIAMAGFSIANLLAAVVSDFGGLLSARPAASFVRR
jgi:predicted MFS family arabinose efflux permease